MRLFAWKLIVSVPFFVALHALHLGKQTWFVSLCFGFVAYALADVVVHTWGKR